MKVELPEFKRCCCCIPLRYGLLGWGYIKLIISLFLVVVISLYLVFYIQVFLLFGFREIIGVIVMGLLLVLSVLLDICFNIVFLIGGHRKTPKLLRACYIYNIVLLCITTLIAVVITAMELIYRITSIGKEMPNEYVSIGFVVQAKIIVVLVNFATQAYVILLIRSEVNKLKNNCNFRFQNVAKEAECTMENGIYGNENGTNENGNGTNENENGTNGLKNGTDETDNEVNDRFDATDNQTETDCESFNYRKFRL